VSPEAVAQPFAIVAASIARATLAHARAGRRMVIHSLDLIILVLLANFSSVLYRMGGTPIGLRQILASVDWRHP
jgi:hypothetical protein